MSQSQGPVRARQTTCGTLTVAEQVDSGNVAVDVCSLVTQTINAGDQVQIDITCLNNDDTDALIDVIMTVDGQQAATVPDVSIPSGGGTTTVAGTIPGSFTAGLSEGDHQVSAAVSNIRVAAPTGRAMHAHEPVRADGGGCGTCGPTPVPGAVPQRRRESPVNHALARSITP